MPFERFDLSTFWEQSEYANDQYVGLSLTQDVIAAAEGYLRYKLPRSYVELCNVQNGGMPVRTAHRMTEQTSWADDHIAVTGIYSIGSEKRYSLCGEFSSEFWVSEWGYPDIGVYFADCPSAGHDMLCLDYRSCGPSGEPQVVHIDQERDYKITMVAPNFESFIRGLESIESFHAGA